MKFTIHMDDFEKEKSLSEPFEAKKLNSKQYEFDIEKIRTNKEYFPHWHDYFEIKLILSGSGTVMLNGDRHLFERGCLYLVVPESIHKFIPKESVELYNITLRESLLLDEQIMQKLFYISGLFFRLEEKEFLNFLSLFELLEIENRSFKEYREQMIKNLLESIIFLLIRKSQKESAYAESYSSGIQIAISYIKAHFRKKITVDEVAAVSGFNSSYFSSLFHKSTGITFVAFITKMRLSYAKRLLCYSEFPVEQVCYESGFKSYSNFLKAFKKEYGCSPRAMRSMEKRE